MNISRIERDDNTELAAFKAAEYPAVDKEHYGDNQPNWDSHYFTLVAKEENTITGFITVTIKLGIAQIDSILVGEKFRNQGIGKQLVIAAENESKSLGAHKIFLETGSNWGTTKFYEGLGYSVRAILPNDVGHQECVLMDKFL